MNHRYRIKNFHEVCNFTDKSNQLFITYINSLLKTKQEASGWPLADPQKRVEDVQAYEVKEAVQIDLEKISVNPGLRSLAKLLFNSFWGSMDSNPTIAKSKTSRPPPAFTSSSWTTPKLSRSTHVRHVRDGGSGKPSHPRSRSRPGEFKHIRSLLHDLLGPGQIVLRGSLFFGCILTPIPSFIPRSRVNRLFPSAWACLRTSWTLVTRSGNSPLWGRKITGMTSGPGKSNARLGVLC